MRIFSVYIIDDHFLIRNGIKTVFENTTRYKIIGESDSAEIALQEILSLKPDIIIIDYFLKNSDGISLLKNIKLINQDSVCVILTNTDEFGIMRKAKVNGAKAFINKQEDSTILLQTIDNIIDYDISYFPKLPNYKYDEEFNDYKHNSEVPVFIPSEIQVIYLLLEGYSTIEISKKLNKSYHTISTLRKIINKKIKDKNFNNFTHFASYAKSKNLF